MCQVKSDLLQLNHVEWWRAYYHWIRPHQTLSERVSGEKPRLRTPAMALGLTDHVWTVGEFLHTPLSTPLARSDPSGPLARKGGVALAA
jgi:hypothetical protein